MADLFQFETSEGFGLVLDLEALVVCWQGKEPNEIVFILDGVTDPLVVQGDYKQFVKDYFDVYDCTPKKKKPCAKKVRGSRSAKAETISLKTMGK